MKTWRRFLSVICVIIVSAACVPLVIPPGEAATPPAVSGEKLVTRDGVALPLRSWKPDGAPPNAVLIALHGFNEYSRFFEDVGPWLAARYGVASYAYDQRGFGESLNRGVWPGEAAFAEDLEAAVTAVRARHPATPLFLVGESMGGAVIMTAMAGPRPPAVDGLVLLAPAVWGRSSMPWYQTLALWMAAHTIPAVGISGRGLGIRPSDNVEMLRERGRDPLIIKQTRIDAAYGLVNLMDRAMAASSRLHGRILILYGENDQLIPPGVIAEMLTRLPGDTSDDRRFGLYAAGYHMLLHDLQREVVWNDIGTWITDPTAPLPSLADAYASEARPLR
ncbi:MAG: alpha/beta hydrolase [Rhodospirillales bacterium]